MAAWLKMICIFVLLAVTACEPAAPPTHTDLSFGGEAWNMELAIGEAAIERGLMGREMIPPGTGMIFLFEDNRVHQFWMGHCLTDMDLVFVDGLGRITAVHEMVAEAPQEPGESEFAYHQRLAQYSSVFPVRVALEFPTGTIKRLGLAPGQATPLDIRALDDLRDRVTAARR
ncbi:MAG: DUF192 domain-containing protein [Phycisphaerales bacterium]|nr:DUF192 domain-containing protein [Phycisphaerales bacterium]